MRRANNLQDPNDPERVVCLTASDLEEGFKGGRTRRNFIYNKACDRVAAARERGPQSFSMARGIETEPECKAALEEATGVVVYDLGFYKHVRIPQFGASPDGVWADKSALIEIKCPSAKWKHMAALDADEIDPLYKTQMLAQISVMLSDGYDCVDFVSYYPLLRPQNLHLAIVRFKPTMAEIMELEEKVITLNNEIDLCIERIKAKHE